MHVGKPNFLSNLSNIHYLGNGVSNLFFLTMVNAILKLQLYSKRRVFRQNRVPKIPGRACGNFVPKVNSGLFVPRKLFRQNRVPKIPWRACGNFVPKHQLRSFRRTQTFPPKQSARDSTDSLLKSKPASPTTCTFNGADASAFYR